MIMLAPPPDGCGVGMASMRPKVYCQRFDVASRNEGGGLSYLAPLGRMIGSSMTSTRFGISCRAGFG